MAKSSPSSPSTASTPSSPLPATDASTAVGSTGTPLPATYEAALKELETLVSGLDAGQLPLDELLAAYQRGAQLLAFCKGKLEVVERQIKVLDGNELKPWTAG